MALARSAVIQATSAGRWCVRGALVSLDATLGPKLVDATAQVQADLASGRTLSQWHVRFAVEADGNTTSDQVDLGAPGTSDAATQPTLKVTYKP